MRVDPALIDPRGQHDLGEGLAFSRPGRLQGAEGRTELDPDFRFCPVKGSHVLRCQTRLQPGEVQRRRRLAVRSRHPCLRVQLPFVFAGTFAEDPYAARGFVRGSVEQNLDARAFRHRTVRLVLIGEDQRTVELQVLDHRSLDALFGSRGGRHGPEHGAGNHETAEYPVVVQPTRMRREQFRVEGDLPAGGFVPRAQKRMPGRGTLPPGRSDPLALALKGIAGYRYPAPLLPGEETRNRNRQPEFVGLGDGAGKRPFRILRRFTGRPQET